MATSVNFGKLFHKKPFKPMHMHMKNATKCVGLMPAAIDAFLRADKEALEDIRQTINQLEGDADKILEELQRRLPRSMFLRVNRHDLLDVLELQEAIADRTQDIINLMLDLPMDVPEEMHKPVQQLVERCVAATNVAENIVKSFVDLAETRFKGPDVERIQKLIHETVAIETDADSLGIDITHTIFAHRNSMDPVCTIFLYKLIHWIDDLADYAEKLAIRTRLLIVR